MPSDYVQHYFIQTVILVYFIEYLYFIIIQLSSRLVASLLICSFLSSPLLLSPLLSSPLLSSPLLSSPLPSPLLYSSPLSSPLPSPLLSSPLLSSSLLSSPLLSSPLLCSPLLSSPLLSSPLLSYRIIVSHLIFCHLRYFSLTLLSFVFAAVLRDLRCLPVTFHRRSCCGWSRSCSVDRSLQTDAPASLAYRSVQLTAIASCLLNAGVTLLARNRAVVSATKPNGMHRSNEHRLIHMRRASVCGVRLYVVCVCTRRVSVCDVRLYACDVRL